MHRKQGSEQRARTVADIKNHPDLYICEFMAEIYLVSGVHISHGCEGRKVCAPGWW